MGWGRYFLLGSLGQQLDIQDHDEDMRRLRSEIDSQSNRDAHQDGQIESVRAENQDLKLYLTLLVRLLVSKNVIAPQEVERIVNSVEKTSVQSQ